GRRGCRTAPVPVVLLAGRAGQRRCVVGAVPGAGEPEGGCAVGAQPAVVADVLGGDRRTVRGYRRVPRTGDGLAVGPGPAHRPPVDGGVAGPDRDLRAEATGPLVHLRVGGGAAAVA